MVVRKRRKKNKLLGHRTHGHGNKKNTRGGGCRGGRGRAGSHKHKYSKYYMTFGTKKILKPKEKVFSVNLDELSMRLEEWTAQGIVGKRGLTYIVDGKKIGYGKILGKGRIGSKIIVSNMATSKKATDKITAAGGGVVVHTANESKESAESEAGG